MTHRGCLKKLAIERRREKVVLEILCADQYTAMMLYDQLIEHGRAGCIKLELIPPRKAPEGA